MRTVKFTSGIICVFGVMALQSAEPGRVDPRPAGEAARVQPADPRWPLPLKTAGNRILNSKDEPVHLRGVNAASLEWTNNGEGHILQSINVAIRDWRANIIRLPLSQDRWFGKGPEQSDRGVSYRALVDELVAACARQTCYIILDLHWSNGGEWGINIGQHSMPDTNSVTFWKDVAARYKNHPAVLFGLYNEPRDVSWDVWLNGGVITEKPAGRRAGGQPKTYLAVGMQPVLDAVRSTGAKNVAFVGGLDWAYDFSGILDGRELKDPNGNGVIYDNHAYPFKGDNAARWIAKMEKAAARLPIFIGEFGGSGGPHRRTIGRARPDPSGDDWLLHVIQAILDHNWSYTAWDFHPAAGPTLIADWTYKPTPDFGVYVQQMLAGNFPRYTPPPPVAEGDTNSTALPGGAASNPAAAPSAPASAAP
jgi:endoglucanase